MSVTSTNGAVASVAGAVSNRSRFAVGQLYDHRRHRGDATLTVRAGAEFGQLTIVVGTPPSGSVPPILARPAGIVVVPAPSAGRLFTAPAGQATFTVRLLSNPAAANTPVTVSSSDPAIASVLNPGVIAVGSDSVAVTVTTGVQGTATLVFRAGAETREVTVVVGTPAAGTVPPILARPVGIVLLAAPSAGRLFTGVAAQSTVTCSCFFPGRVPTPVAFSTSNADVASVVGPVVIAAGAIGANVTVATGIEGTATLTFTGGGQTRELTVVVGTPPPGTVPPVLARPVGVVMIPQRQLGSVFSAIGAPASVNLTLLSAPAEGAVPVIVTSSDPNVATVSGDVIIPAGSKIASLNIAAGAQGVATLTLRAGSEVAQIYVVVGTPPASHLPLIVAPIVGVSSQSSNKENQSWKWPMAITRVGARGGALCSSASAGCRIWCGRIASGAAQCLRVYQQPGFAGDVGQHHRQHVSAWDDHAFRLAPSAIATKRGNGVQRHQSGRQVGRAGDHFIHPQCRQHAGDIAREWQRHDWRICHP